MNENAKYLNAFNQIPELGTVSLNKIKKQFNDFKTAWQNSEKKFKTINLSQKVITIILKARKKIDPEKELQKLIQEKITIIDYDDKNYPQLLKKISQPPIILYLKGNHKLLLENNLLIAIVGTRRASAYGKQVVFILANDLAQAGLVIVSGLAKGIDATAHEVTLEAKGKTIAVLGTGLDNKSFYPKINLKLGQKIIEENGLLISEYPIGTKGLRQNFPQRNRIIAGLSLGVIIVEAKKKSGALITAQFAVKEKRKVFAVPGTINTLNSQGPHLLIKQGAKLIENADDVLKELNLVNEIKPLANQQVNGNHSLKHSLETSLILFCLQESLLHINEIAKKTKLPIAKTISVLTVLEIDKKIKNFGAGVYGIREV